MAGKDSDVKRREFMMGAAALAAAGCPGLGAAGGEAAWRPRKPHGRKVRVVQWGMCYEHADGKFSSAKKLPDDFELVGIVDDRASKTARLRTKFDHFKGVPFITEEQLFADKTIDAVFVEVTNDDLIEVGMKCAEHGLPMHLDKPCGQTLAPFVRLVELCRRKNLPLQIGYMFRVNPAIRFAQKAVKDGWLGDIVSIEADMNHNYGGKPYPHYIATFKGGVLYNLGCHLVDFILPMMPGMPTRAHPVLLSAPGDPEGPKTNCVSVIEWPHATVTIRSCSQSACSKRWLRVSGTKGTIDLAPIERFDGKPTTLELRLKHDVPGYAKGTHIVDCGVQKDRYAEQLLELAKIVRGEIPNPDLYDHDIAVHRVTLMACGML